MMMCMGWGLFPDLGDDVEEESYLHKVYRNGKLFSEQPFGQIEL